MPKREIKNVPTIARTGAIILAIILLSFIIVFLLADILTQGRFRGGESLASFFNLFSLERNKCDCEYSSEYNSYICNPFCGELAGALCLSRSDCL